MAGSAGSDTGVDGSGRAARLASDLRPVSDAAGNLYMLSAVQVLAASTNLASPAGTLTSTNRDALRIMSATGTLSSTVLDDAPGMIDSGGGLLALAPDGRLFSTTDGKICSLDASGHIANVYTGQHWPHQIAFNGAGTLYLMAPDGIRAMAPGGAVTDFVGTYLNPANEGTRLDGQGPAARFGNLQDMTVGRDGTLYVIDGPTVRKITPGGAVSTLTILDDRHHPMSVAVAPDGKVLVLVTDLTVPFVARALTYEEYYAYVSPNPVQLHPSRAVLKLDHLGTATTVASGLATPQRILVDGLGRTLLVGAAIDVLTNDGSVSALAGWRNDSVYDDIDGPAAQARFTAPRLIAHAPDGTLYVVEVGAPGREPLRRIAPDGKVTTLWNGSTWWTGGAGPVITHVQGMAADSHGNLYIGDGGILAGRARFSTFEKGGSIVKIAPNGKFSVLAGLHGTDPLGAAVDGEGPQARFCNPAVIGVDGADNVYVSDGCGPNQLHKITPGAVVSTVASLPAGLLTDAAGNSYEVGQGYLFKRAVNNTVTAIAGNGFLATIPGPLPGSLNPRAVAQMGPKSFALISGSAIVKVVLP